MGYLKELMNDNTIATVSNESASILCSTVSKIYIGVVKVTNNFDPDALFVTVRIGDTTVIPRISLEVLGNIFAYHEGGDHGMANAGDQSTATQYGIDLGCWPVPEGSRLYVEIENTDAESQIFNISALVDQIQEPFPKAYGKSTDTNFVVDNLLEVYSHAPAGDLESEANYISINDKRVSVEQAWVRTACESVNGGIGAESTATFAVDYQSSIPEDVEVKAEYPAGDIVTYYLYQFESSGINAALKTTVEPMVKKQLAGLSALNKSALATRSGIATPVGQPKRVKMS